MNGDNYNVDRSYSRPIQEARKALKILYDKILQEKSASVQLEDFYPINLDLLTNLLGWSLERVDGIGLSESFEPLDAYADFEKQTIMLSTDGNIPRSRMNFSHAHEIGHIILHEKDGVKLLRRTRSVREIRLNHTRDINYYEVEADRFATELLMPARAIRYWFQHLFGCQQIIKGTPLARKFSGYSYNISSQQLASSVAIYTPESNESSLTKFFGVSDKAMAKRLIELRLVLN